MQHTIRTSRWVWESWLIWMSQYNPLVPAVSNSTLLLIHCNTAPHCNTIWTLSRFPIRHLCELTATHCSTLHNGARFRIQHGCKLTATNCNILQHTIKPCIVCNSAPLRVWRNSEKVENWWNYVCRVVDKSRMSSGHKSPQHCWKKLDQFVMSQMSAT